MERALEIQEESANRLGGDKKAESTPTKLAILHFETPVGKKGKKK